MDQTNKQKLKDIFTVVLELSSDTELTKVRRMAQPNWDSLAHTSLIVAIESEFGIVLDMPEMERITSFEAARLFLEEKGL